MKIPTCRRVGDAASLWETVVMPRSFSANWETLKLKQKESVVGSTESGLQEVCSLQFRKLLNNQVRKQRPALGGIQWARRAQGVVLSLLSSVIFHTQFAYFRFFQ